MKIFMNHKVFVIVGLIGLPIVTWALLAWEPFDRLLGHFFPEMFYDNLGRFYPYTPIEAFGATIVLTVYAAVPVAVILLVVGMVRSVRRRGLGMTVKKGATGVVGILSVFWMVMIAVAGFVMDMLEVDEKYVRAEEEREEEEKEWDRIRHG